MKKIFGLMSDNNIFNEYNFKLVALHADSEGFARALESLIQANILTQENRTAVASHANPRDVVHALALLSVANMLTQANFTSLFQQEHQILLTPIMSDIIWSRLSHNHLRDNWEHILETSRNPNPQEALATLINQI